MIDISINFITADCVVHSLKMVLLITKLLCVVCVTGIIYTSRFCTGSLQKNEYEVNMSTCTVNPSNTDGLKNCKGQESHPTTCIIVKQLEDIQAALLVKKDTWISQKGENIYLCHF